MRKILSTGKTFPRKTVSKWTVVFSEANAMINFKKFLEVTNLTWKLIVRLHNNSEKAVLERQNKLMLGI